MRWKVSCMRDGRYLVCEKEGILYERWEVPCVFDRGTLSAR